MRGGWYCADCGAMPFVLPSGLVTCPHCGGLGLRGYERRPRRLICDDHPAWRGWDDGGVNDDLGRHRRQQHTHPTCNHFPGQTVCDWCRPAAPPAAPGLREAHEALYRAVHEYLWSEVGANAREEANVMRAHDVVANLSRGALAETPGEPHE